MDADRRSSGAGRALPDISGQRGSAGFLLVLRRMRAPLIVLILIFAISVFGLTLIPGEDQAGRPHRMTMFEAFYFMSYTASTIGFGEIPYAFTPAQRMWVTFSIFLSVFGWAYAVGSLLALAQDRAFRRALARRHFAGKVAKLGEPFLLLVGYGNATKRLARSLDDMGRRFVVVDRAENRVAAVDLDAYRADTPALLGDAHDTGHLALAGLGHAHCAGVVALTGDDTTNLDVAMTTALLRPDLPVIARTSSREVAEQMRTFGAPEVVNPLDRFGDHLRIVLRSPAAYRLMIWLTSAPGTPLPRRREPLPRGRWLVCGSGRFAVELTRDLRREGIEVATFSRATPTPPRPEAEDTIEADAPRAEDVAASTAFVAATESDATNLWLVEAARQANPEVFLVALQNRTSNAALYRAVGIDFGLVPAEVVAHEVLARLANPALMRFLPEVPHQGEEWATTMIDRLVERCGTRTPNLWQLRLDDDETPAVAPWLERGGLRLGDLLRSPKDRVRPLDVVPLAVLTEDTTVLAPDDGYRLRCGDQLLLAGRPASRWALEATLHDEPIATYVVEGRAAPTGWVWRRLAAAARAESREE